MSSLGLSIHISHKVTCWGVSNSMWDMQFLLGLSCFKSETGHSNCRLWFIDVLMYDGLRGCRQRHPPGGRLLPFVLGQFSDRYVLNELGCHDNSLCEGNEITELSSYCCWAGFTLMSDLLYVFCYLALLQTPLLQSSHLVTWKQVLALAGWRGKVLCFSYKDVLI